MLNRVNYFFSILIMIIIFFSFTLNGKKERDMVFSFIPYNIKNIAGINLKKYFQLYDYNDAYKLSFLKENKTLKVLKNIMKKAGIDPEKDLNYLLFANNYKFDSINIEKLISELVIILKVSYDPDRLKKSILSILKKTFDIKNDRLERKSIIHLKNKSFEYSILLHDEMTIIIGNKDKVTESMHTFSRNRKNILSNKKLNSALNAIKKKPIFSYYIEYSKFFRELLEQSDDSFNMDLKNVLNFEGSLDSDKMAWNGEINIISNNEKGNKQTEKGLRKLLAMSAMGGPKYIELAQKININAGKNRIRIFFTFDVE